MKLLCAPGLFSANTLSGPDLDRPLNGLLSGDLTGLPVLIENIAQEAVATEKVAVILIVEQIID